MRPIVDSRFEQFKAAYATGLAKAVNDKPDEFLYGPDKVPTVVDKMMGAIRQSGTARTVLFKSDGFKNACRALGIKNTATAIDDFLQGLS